MRVDVRLLCVDVAPDLSRGSVELPEGATIGDALEEYAREYDIKLPLEEFKNSLFLINKTSSALESPLINGDLLTVMRTLAGG